MNDDDFDVETIAGISYIHINSRRIDSCLRHYLEQRIDWVVVNAARGYDLRNIDFLKEHPYVKNILIVPPRKHPFDLTGLSALQELRGLVLNGDIPVSLAEFPQLRQFSGAWSEKLCLSACRSLEMLHLYHFKVKGGDISTLPDFPALRELGLSQSAVISLRGIARYTHLHKVRLAYLTKLRTIAEVAALPDLEDLDVASCKKIQDHQVVRALKKLRVLKFNECGEIASLAFVNEMPALEFFAFVGTNVVDGDLRPLLRLKYAGFSEKKHFSHTRNDLDTLMRVHDGTAIVRLHDE